MLFFYLRSVVSDWQSLVTREKFTRAVALSLVIHRLTGTKETIKLLHCLEPGISYNDVKKQINTFSAEVQTNVNLAQKNISKGQPIHITNTVSQS